MKARQVVVDLGCLDCPFMWEFDEEADHYRCSLLDRGSVLGSRFIGMRHADGKIRNRRGRIIDVIATPEWCPLRVRPALVSLKTRPKAQKEEEK